MSDSNSTQFGNLVTAFAIGGLVGAGIALLLAPQSGKETRDLLSRKSRELSDKAGDALNDVRESVRSKSAPIIAAVGEAIRPAVAGSTLNR
jgi:gas vesicle protein